MANKDGLPNPSRAHKPTASKHNRVSDEASSVAAKTGELAASNK